MGKKSKTDHLDFEIGFFEKLLEKRPQFFDALAALGDLYTKKGLYEKGLEIDQRLRELKPNDPIVLYNLACSFSLLNNIEQAITAIQQAFESGYNNFTYLSLDPDLNNLRNDDRFRKIFESLGYHNKERRA